MKTMFKMAVRWGYLGSNPAERVKMLKEDPVVPKALTEGQIHALLKALPNVVGCPDPATVQKIVIVAVETGMRKSELFGLEWQDVDFDRRRVTVRRAKGDVFRVIPMSDWVFETLQEQRQKGVIPYVLPSPTHKQYDSVKKSLHTAGEAAGIGHVHMHMLRHTFATRLRERGVPLDRIMDLLGHKTMAMTLRYAKVTPIQLEEAIEALNRPVRKQVRETTL